jgi:hypothetical protein
LTAQERQWRAGIDEADPEVLGQACLNGPKASVRLQITGPRNGAGWYAGTHQARAAKLDQMGAETARKGGVPTTVVSWPNTTPWQEEDRVWFEANPDRSHRLRDPWEAEVPELKMRVGGGEPAPGCKLQVLARQVEPGNRIRAAVVHDLGWPVDVDPNIEPLAHALFPKARHRNAAPSSA